MTLSKDFEQREIVIGINLLAAAMILTPIEVET